MSRPLEGQNVLVTGAARARGIGRAIALRLARDGAAVAVSGLPRDPSTFPEHERAAGWRGSASVVDEIVAAGGKAITTDCDVTQPPDVEAAVARVVEAFGSVTALVNNAGAPSNAGSAGIVEMDDQLWADTIAVNLTGTYNVSKAVARALLRGGAGGAIVNIASLAGRTGVANYGAYCASKFGVIGLTQQMALELAGAGIRVNCVCPGMTDTDMMEGTWERTARLHGVASDQVRRNATAAIPLRRQARPDEQAAAVAFLIGPDASYVTGQTLNVCGGVRLN